MCKGGSSFSCVSSEVNFNGVVTKDLALLLFCMGWLDSGPGLLGDRGGLKTPHLIIFWAFSRRLPAYGCCHLSTLVRPAVMDFIYSIRQMYNGGHLIWRFIWYES